MPEKPKFTDDWDRERKKQKVLSLVLVAALVVVAILVLISPAAVIPLVLCGFSGTRRTFQVPLQGAPF